MRIRGIAVGLALLVIAGCGSKHSPTRPAAPVTLASVVDQARLAHRLPALGAASFDLDSIVVAVSGVRRLGVSGAVTMNDLFHVGSLTKGMLATAIGKLVQQGTLSWSLTMGDAFPELAATMDTAYRDVTLAALLQNHGGVPGFNELADYAVLPAFPGDVTAQRLEFAQWILVRPPAAPPGTYFYSTAGFAIAAAVAERRSGRNWDELLRTEILDPIGSAMFVGWPLDFGPNQPCGHAIVGGVLQPIEPAFGHVPAIVAPGGDLSLAMRDYSRYAQLHLRALCGRPELLADSVWQALHAPNGDYAMGWDVISTGGNVALAHGGSAGTFTAFVVLYRNERHGFLVVTNAVTPEVETAIAEVITALAPTVAPTAVRASVASAIARRVRF